MSPSPTGGDVTPPVHKQARLKASHYANRKYYKGLPKKTGFFAIAQNDILISAQNDILITGMFLCVEGGAGMGRTKRKAGSFSQEIRPPFSLSR